MTTTFKFNGCDVTVNDENAKKIGFANNIKELHVEYKVVEMVQDKADVRNFVPGNVMDLTISPKNLEIVLNSDLLVSEELKRDCNNLEFDCFNLKYYTQYIKISQYYYSLVLVNLILKSEYLNKIISRLTYIYDYVYSRKMNKQYLPDYILPENKTFIVNYSSA